LVAGLTMFRIAIKPEIIAHGQYLVKNTNYGNRGVDDGDKHDQLIGIVAQCAIMDLMGYELPEVTHEADGGIDIVYDGIKIDIKTIACKSYPTLNYSAIIFANQKHYQTDVYIFSMVHREDKMLTITGWMDKADFFKKATMRKKGDVINAKLTLRSDDYELKIAELNQVNNYIELVNGLDEYF
jgi:hypothetical protein